MNVGAWIKKAEEMFPLEWCEEWDNSGLIVGDCESHLLKVGVAVDVTLETVYAAIAEGCQILAVHHPPIFRPIRQLVMPSGGALYAAIRSGVSIYASHTNFDVSPMGVNIILARAIGLGDSSPIIKSRHERAFGLGAWGDLPQARTVDGVLSEAVSAWGLKRMDRYGYGNREVRRIALCGGSGGDMWREAHSLGAQLFITADMGYHARMDALSANMCIGIADHGEMERFAMEAYRWAVGDIAPAVMLSEPGPDYRQIAPAGTQTSNQIQEVNSI